MTSTARPVPTDGLTEPVLPDCIFCTKNDHWSVDCQRHAHAVMLANLRESVDLGEARS